MKYISKIICLTICYSLLLTPTVSAQEAIKKHKKSVLISLLQNIEKRYALTASNIDNKTVTSLSKERQRLGRKILLKDLRELKNGEMSLEEYKESLVKKTMQEAGVQKKEFRYHLSLLSTGQLDILSETLTENINYTDSNLAYASAFTRDEKLKVLTEVIDRDFDGLLTMNIKKIGSLDMDGAIKGLEQSLTKLDRLHKNGQKGLDKEKILKILAIAGTAVLVAGIIGWAKYHGDYKSAKDERESKLNQLRKKLEQDFQNLDQELSQQEQDYLRENNYQLMECGNYQRPDSIICSNYNYNLISGTKYCTINCYKNTETDQETGHQPPVCSSPFIPTDCDDPNEYFRGYDTGYEIGYDYGYADGDVDGYNDGADDGYQDGDDRGWDDGYDDGYQDGFDDGYWDYSYGWKKTNNARITKSSNQGYKKGYQQGQKDAKLLFSFGLN